MRLRENSRLAWNGIVAGRLSGARMVTPPTATVSPGLRQLAVAAAVGAEVHDHRARLHRPHHVGR